MKDRRKMEITDGFLKKWDDLSIKAAKALSYPLCDRCLGRLFARTGFGLDNEQRGKAIRICLAMAYESLGEGERIELPFITRIPVHKETYKASKNNEAEKKSCEGWTSTDTPSFSSPWNDERPKESCWLCHDIFCELDQLRDLVIDSSKELEVSTFLIGCSLDPATASREKLLWSEVNPDSAEPIKEELNREIGKKLESSNLGLTFDRDEPEVTFIVDPLFKQVKLQIKPVFVYGRYRKLIRGIPQTRWPCRKCRGKGCQECDGTGRRYGSSVEEMIGEHLRNAFNGSEYRMHGMGREDVDVRMLGNGRPFIMEIREPNSRDIDIEKQKNTINAVNKDKVEVEDLRMTNRAEVQRIKRGTSKKRYRAHISIEGPLEEENLKYAISLLARSPISQRTPTRVSHRRADKIRERCVHEVSVSMNGGENFSVDLLADGGLYIKELLHGDGGRTEPSLSSLLGKEIKVKNLDVTGVLDDEKDQKKDGEGHGKEV